MRCAVVGIKNDEGLKARPNSGSAQTFHAIRSGCPGPDPGLAPASGGRDVPAGGGGAGDGGAGDDGGAGAGADPTGAPFLGRVSGPEGVCRPPVPFGAGWLATGG